ncbi:MAG: hypothetical protein IJ013_04820, partial [Bacteroidaceae bacterium]|nr:hypothetical protein [Bacteroidaceae bacterium]
VYFDDFTHHILCVTLLYGHKGAVALYPQPIPLASDDAVKDVFATEVENTTSFSGFIVIRLLHAE